MERRIEYTRRERFWLWTLAVFGLAVINGTFVYAVLFQPGALAEAMSNPIAAVLMVEALLLVGVLAYLLSRWGVNRLGWAGFVLLSLLGSLAFALPVVLLWPRGRTRPGST